MLLIPLISVIFCLFFLYGTFIFTGYHFRYQTGIHLYLVMVEIGVSLFMASILTLIYQNINRHLRYIGIILILIFLISSFISNSLEIKNFFYSFTAQGNDINKENFMQKQLISNIPRDKLTQKILIYVEPTKDPSDLPWAIATDAYYLNAWFNVRKSYLTQNKLDGCLARIIDLDELQIAARLQGNTKGFIAAGNCLGDAAQFNSDKIFFTIDDFYAFWIKGSKIVDIREEILRNLPITN